MKIKWWGHSLFLITSDEGVRILTDPYETGGSIGYSRITEEADIVTISHEHSDHNYTAGLKGSPQIVRGGGTKKAKGISFKGVQVYHDPKKGKMRGANTIFSYEVDGVTFCHLGDLGHTLSDKQAEEIGKVDILFAPVGGHFTIDAEEATQVVEKLKPRVVIPMHYKTKVLGFPIASVDPFLKGKDNVRRIDSAEVEFSRDELPDEIEIWVLKYVGQ